MQADRTAWRRAGRLKAWCRAALLPAIGFAAAALAMPAASWAQGSALYSVEGIAVDVTAKSPTAARGQAIAQGRAQAYRALIDRLVPKEDQPLVPPWSKEYSDTLFRGFGVEDEKTSDVRYIAKVTYHFKPEAVRELLTASGVRFIGKEARPVTILALWREGEEVFLWGEINPWREAWEKHQTGQLMVPIKLPLGDLTDLATIDAKQAETGDRVALVDMADRYETAESLVVAARVKDGTFSATARRYGLAVNGEVVGGYSEKVEGPLAEVMDRAIAAILQKIGGNWKDRALATAGIEEPILVQVTYDNLAEWSAIIRRVRAVRLVKTTEVLSVTRGVRKMRLVVSGGLDALGAAFNAADLILSQIEPPLDDGTSFSIALVPGALERKPRDGGEGAAGGGTGGPGGESGATGSTGGGEGGSTGADSGATGGDEGNRAAGAAAASGTGGAGGSGATGGEVLLGPRTIGGAVVKKPSADPSVGAVKEVPLSGGPEVIRSGAAGGGTGEAGATGGTPGGEEGAEGGAGGTLGSDGEGGEGGTGGGEGAE